MARHKDPERIEYMRKWREANREKANTYSREHKASNRIAQRASKLKERYGITLEEYDTMLLEQNGGCKICGSPDPKRKGSKHLVVDHCHDTGAVRGLLCYRCNVGLGNFEDDLNLLLYLTNYASIRSNGQIYLK